jgi:exodeoxyribonuclease V gamma subunit
MVPMRSVPHRVVCLVGLDDGVFPRLVVPDGDDVLARTPMTGDRDIRSEDRQLLLDAVCAATETLVITYTGADAYTGHPRPPAVPLDELLDALDQTTQTPVRRQIVTQHPLQPFDRKNVTPGVLVPDTPFTFDPTALAAAEAATGKRSAPTAFITEPLAAPPKADVALADLLDFFKDPVKGFFRALDCVLPWDVDEVSDAMPVEIDPLETWTVGDRMLHDMLRGMDLKTVAEVEWRRGTLPPELLGWRKAKEIRCSADELATTARHYQGVNQPHAHDIVVDVGDGRRVTGTVNRVFDDRIVEVTYSKLAPKHKLQAWISLVALAAGRPDRDWTAISVGRGDKDPVAVCRLRTPPDPLAVLADLVALFDAGRREPLPLPLKTSYAWAERRYGGKDPEKYARSKWESNKWDGEDRDKANVRVWGSNPRFDVLLDPPRPGEEMPGEDTRLGALAARLWLPVLAAEGEPD